MNWRNLRDRLLIGHIIVWSSLLCLFLFQSAPISTHAVLENRIGPIEANHSTDLYLQALAGLQNGSQSVDESLQSLPKGKRLLIFVRSDNSPSEFLGMLIAYLSWPRQVQIVKLRGTTADKEVVAIAPASVAGIVFCSVTPPTWLGKGIRLGSSILLVPVPAPEARP